MHSRRISRHNYFPKTSAVGLDCHVSIRILVSQYKYSLPHCTGKIFIPRREVPWGQLRPGPLTHPTVHPGTPPLVFALQHLAMTESTAIGRGTRAAIWVGFYVLCWLLMGLSCRVDLPHDCRRASEPMEVLIELPVLLAFALGQVGAARVCCTLCDLLAGGSFFVQA